MNWKILDSPTVRAFIQNNLLENTERLILNRARFPDLPMTEIVNQIVARRKAAKKLPTWVANAEIIFPTAVSLEQSSSETTAKFKANLIEGKTVADLTGGFGIDVF